MAEFKTLDDLGDLTGKRVLLRADLNVPMKDGRVTDDTRIRAAAPTVADLLAKGAQVVLMSHFGRPKGKVVPEMSLSPLTAPLEAAFGAPVTFAADADGLAGMDRLALLENLRFHPGEEANDPAFAATLAELGEIYVNDAFSAAHRAHASTEGIAHLMPAAAGRSMQAELSALASALGDPVRPVAAVVGGAKVSSKLDVLTNLVTRVDHLIIGGGMANTFLAAQGIDVGKSLCEHDLAQTAREILDRAEASGCRIYLPSDVVVAKEFAANPETRTCRPDEVAADEMILDLGQGSAGEVCAIFSEAKTLIWNGPLGAFETPPFEAATMAAAQAAARLTRDGALLSVAGGGDTVAALNMAGVKDDFTHVSTAGGAFLEWMEGKALPGVEVLKSAAALG
ncbi:MAG: phosphoglycerate kinase [Sphingomonadales bacterium]|nr:phosphoglycerate kinase [Sphingomonadales bacterium]